MLFTAPNHARQLTRRAARRKLGKEVLDMSTNPPSGPTVGQRLDETIARIETELRNAVSYVNDDVLPQVRKESISALRTAADSLHSLANRIDASRNQPDQNQPKGPQS